MALSRNGVRWAIAGGAVAILGIGAWLFFGVFAFQTAFIDDEVDEAGPVFESGAGTSGLAGDELTESDAAAMNDAMEDDAVPSVDEVDEEKPPMGEPDVEVVGEGSFIDRSHPTSGLATVLNDGSEQRFLRFEDFETDNGPDLDVYLSTAAPDASAGEFDDDFIDLGDLKGNVGPQNYEIGADVDLDRYSTVVIWCVRFGVAFGAADLTP